MLGWWQGTNGFFSFFHFCLSSPRKSCLAMQNFRVVVWFWDVEFDPYYFDFEFLFLDSFIKFWFVFNLIIQPQFVICYFKKIWFLFFWLFFSHFVKLIFLFNSTLQLKKIFLFLILILIILINFSCIFLKFIFLFIFNFQ